jgi:pimeloyl-ACP methyl ester carboxylesterase
MAQRLFAVLVGINAYQGGVSSLNGCVNDVLAMRDYLTNRAGESHIRILTAGHSADEEKPTRANIIAAIRAHLRQAGPNDVALFYYSGHGSYEDAPHEFWQAEPDRRNETLVCQDSRTPGQWDLADKELAQLIHEVATQDISGADKSGTPHIVLIVDACHSGSISRSAADAQASRVDASQVRERLFEADKRTRSAADYIISADALRAAGDAPGTAPTSGWKFTWSRHVLMSACRSDQTAKERVINGATRGIFTTQLLTQLQRNGAPASYRELARAIAPAVRNSIDEQDPQLEALDGNDLNREFLNGALRTLPAFVQIAFDQSSGEWRADAGQVHGCTNGMVYALYPGDAAIGAQTTLASRIGEASVTGVSAAHARVALQLASGAAVQTEQSFRGLVLKAPSATLLVHFAGDTAAVTKLRDALNNPAMTHPSRFLLSEAADAAQCEFTVLANATEYRLHRAGTLPAQDITASDVASAMDKLAHMARWRMTLDLNHSGTRLTGSNGKPPVEIVITRAGESTPVTDAIIQGIQDSAKSKYALYHIKLVNNSTRRLFAALYHLSDTYGVNANFIRGAWLEPGSEAHALTSGGRDQIFVGIRPEREQAGVTQSSDVFKAIAATAEFDVVALEQHDLAAIERDAGDVPGALEDSDDWCVHSRQLVTIATPQTVSVPANGQSQHLTFLPIVLHGHAALRAAVAFEDSATSSRAAGQTAYPPLLTPGATAMPFNLAGVGERGANPVSTMTLSFSGGPSGAGGAEAVTPEAPLWLTVQQSLEDDAALLVTAYDSTSGLHLPVGYGDAAADGIDIRIETLPEPAALPVYRDGSRSITSAITLAFHKIVSNKLGSGVSPNTLWLCTRDAQGNLQRNEDTAAVRAAISAAQRVWIFVHGFTGDSDSMPLAAWHAMPSSETGTVVLAYDYENLLTEIQDTARLLRDALQAAGLAPGHGKDVVLIGHSLGTMITRWMIEQTPGGSALVSRAVLIGGPNAGTPAARAEDLLAFLLGAAINGLLTLSFPWAIIPKLLAALGSGVSLAKGAIKTLDQIKPGATFYDTLNDATVDPHVPYTVIAGDVKLLIAADKLNGKQRQLLSLATRYRLLSLLFANKPNDMIVSVDSIRAVPATRTPAPVMLPTLACDHVSYFAQQDALDQLRQALS